MVMATAEVATMNRPQKNSRRVNMSKDSVEWELRWSLAAAMDPGSRQMFQRDKIKRSQPAGAAEGCDLSQATKISARYEVLLRRTPGNQAGHVVQFLCGLINSTGMCSAKTPNWARDCLAVSNTALKSCVTDIKPGILIGLQIFQLIQNYSTIFK
jgi:hypothetical protein